MTSLYLPKLDRVVIKDYSLYKKNIDFSIHEGVNIVVGGNGLGKTTFLNLVVFAITGSADKKYKPKLSPSYFTSRIKNHKEWSPKVYVEFSIKDVKFIIERSIKTGTLLYLNVKGNEIKDEHLEEKYIEKVKEYSNFKLFTDFCFILKSLLYAGEERDMILWNLETHAKILRLLFIGKDYEESFGAIEKAARDANNKWRHASAYNENLREEKRKLEKKRRKSLSEGKELNLEKEIERIQKEIEEKRQQASLLHNSIEIDTRLRERRSMEIDKISEKLEELNEKMMNLEFSFHQNIYPEKSPIFEEIKNQMRSYGKCIFCNAQDANLKKIAKERKSSQHCIICGNPFVEPHKKLEGSSLEISKKINDLMITKNEMEKNRTDLIHELEVMKDKIKEKNAALEKLRNEKETLELKLSQMESRKDFIKIDTVTVTDIDLQIYNYENIIRHREKLVADYYEEWKEKKGDLENHIKDMKDKLNKFLGAFNKKFESYASAFLGKDCKLESESKKMDTIAVGMSVFYPKFDKKIRTSKSSVSETQALFLDHAYRFAIISLLKNTTDFTTMYFAETPEAFSDLAYVRHTGKMFSNFCKEKHTVIITSNLNGKSFLNELLRNVKKDEREPRLLNLLKIGNLTEVQEERKKEFASILRESIK